MRQIYEELQSALLSENQSREIRQLATDDIEIDLLVVNRPTVSDDLDNDKWNCFVSIGFSHHYEKLIRTSTLEERFFYIAKSATELPENIGIFFRMQMN